MTTRPAVHRRRHHRRLPKSEAAPFAADGNPVQSSATSHNSTAGVSASSGSANHGSASRRTAAHGLTDHVSRAGEDATLSTLEKEVQENVSRLMETVQQALSAASRTSELSHGNGLEEGEILDSDMDISEESSDSSGDDSSSDKVPDKSDSEGRSSSVSKSSFLHAESQCYDVRNQIYSMCSWIRHDSNNRRSNVQTTYQHTPKVLSKSDRRSSSRQRLGTTHHKQQQLLR